MHEPLSSEADPLREAHILHRLMVYETACALAESASLADAAPRMLQAVCQSLGWEYGALWEVIADRVGLRSAFAMPMLRGDDVLGVMEFFSCDTRQPDADLVRTLATVGSQIGVYVDRKRSTEELDRFFTVSLDILGIANFDGYFLRVNPAWERVLGINPQELLREY